jgi:hypothetical protein
LVARKTLQYLACHRRLGPDAQHCADRYRYAFNTFQCNPYLMMAKAAERSMPPWPAAKLKQ